MRFMVFFYSFTPGICEQSSDLPGLGARVCCVLGTAGNVTYRDCHLQGMSPPGMSVHPSATGRGASLCQLWMDPGSPFPLPEMLPGPPHSFSTPCPLHCSFPSFVSSFPSLPAPFPPLLLPFPLEEGISLPCPAHPSPTPSLGPGSCCRICQQIAWMANEHLGSLQPSRGHGNYLPARDRVPPRDGSRLRGCERGEPTPEAEPAPTLDPEYADPHGGSVGIFGREGFSSWAGLSGPSPGSPPVLPEQFCSVPGEENDRDTLPVQGRCRTRDLSFPSLGRGGGTGRGCGLLLKCQLFC